VEVVLYTRAGCHLCEVAKEVIERVRARVPFALSVIDVDTDPSLQEQFGLEVPVVFVGGRKHAKYRLDERAFEERLRRSDSERSEVETTIPRGTQRP
jgi:glutaredoxin